MNMWLIVVFSLRISHPIDRVDNKISARIVAFCVAFLFVRDSASFFEKRNFVFRDAARSWFSEVAGVPRKTKVSGFLCPKKGRCEVAQLPFFGPSFLGKAVWTASKSLGTKLPSTYDRSGYCVMRCAVTSRDR